MFYTLASATNPAHNTQRHHAAAGNSGIEKFLNSTLSSSASAALARSASIEDTDAAYALQLDVPGLAKDHLDIAIEGDVVRVSSTPGASRSVKAAWRFPLEIDAANSHAQLEHGVLHLQLAKKIPVSNVHQLAIS